MKIKFKFFKWVILVFIIFFCAIALNTALENDEKNPHNLAANPENCFYCHNKSSIPTEEAKFMKVQLTHKFKLETEDCEQCHSMDDSSQTKQSRYKKSIPELCVEPCHRDGALGLNHPVEIVPDFEVPSSLPLENGEITCGTCHDPHSSPTIKTKSFIGWKEGKSYFLRIDNSHGDLCRVCHTDYPVFN
ncbi:MAG: cytochrome c3 family protein [bacterium]|nr:cytochrome c3 family protein [bacterium]